VNKWKIRERVSARGEPGSEKKWWCRSEGKQADPSSELMSRCDIKPLKNTGLEEKVLGQNNGCPVSHHSFMVSLASKRQALGLVLLEPNPQQSCWPTYRPVSYSAGLCDLQYRVYLGYAKWSTGQLAKQQAAIYLMCAYKAALFSVSCGRPSRLLRRPSRPPCRLSASSLTTLSIMR
jgi:hypothetical protein